MVDRIIALRRWMFGEVQVKLDSWIPEAGRSNVLSKEEKVWITVRGIPLHLRSKELFKQLGDICGTFLEFDSGDSLSSVRLGIQLKGVIPEEIPILHGNQIFPVRVEVESVVSKSGNGESSGLLKGWRGKGKEVFVPKSLSKRCQGGEGCSSGFRVAVDHPLENSAVLLEELLPAVALAAQNKSSSWSLGASILELVEEDNEATSVVSHREDVAFSQRKGMGVDLEVKSVLLPRFGSNFVGLTIERDYMLKLVTKGGALVLEGFLGRRKEGEFGPSAIWASLKLGLLGHVKDLVPPMPFPLGSKRCVGLSYAPEKSESLQISSVLSASGVQLEALYVEAEFPPDSLQVRLVESAGEGVSRPPLAVDRGELCCQSEAEALIKEVSLVGKLIGLEKDGDAEAGVDAALSVCDAILIRRGLSPPRSRLELELRRLGASPGSLEGPSRRVRKSRFGVRVSSSNVF
ncbi:hypothetical protein LINPERHAP2_LOCUS39497 [Linum perenne]